MHSSWCILYFNLGITMDAASMGDPRGLFWLCGWDTGAWLRGFHH